jgi:hypothetical protein
MSASAAAVAWVKGFIAFSQMASQIGKDKEVEEVPCSYCQYIFSCLKQDLVKLHLLVVLIAEAC